MLDFVAGFLSAWILRSLLQRRLSRSGGNIGATPLVRSINPLPSPPMSDQPLSPAAHAVLDAFTGNDTIHGLHLMTPRLAAALRAAADRVVPDIGYEADCLNEPVESELQCIRNRFLAIAAELEAR